MPTREVQEAGTSHPEAAALTWPLHGQIWELQGLCELTSLRPPSPATPQSHIWGPAELRSCKDLTHSWQLQEVSEER